MKFLTPYTYVPKKGIENTDASATQQQFKRECDINSIMDKYYRTGCLSDPNQTMRPMTYGDFSDLGNYMDNMNKIVEAREMFEALPARVRERFANNPANMLDFVMDESNRDEAIKLGLLDVPEVPETVTAETAAEVGSTTEGNA